MGWQKHWRDNGRCQPPKHSPKAKTTSRDPWRFPRNDHLSGKGGDQHISRSVNHKVYMYLCLHVCDLIPAYVVREGHFSNELLFFRSLIDHSLFLGPHTEHI